MKKLAKRKSSKKHGRRASNKNKESKIKKLVNLARKGTDRK